MIDKTMFVTSYINILPDLADFVLPESIILFFLSQPLHGMTGPLVGLSGDKVQHVEASLEV